MKTYLVRRLLLMIPTLFGVTIVSFCIMQLAPGDPLLNQLGTTGMTGQSSQTREAYLIQKRDLQLDKPLVLNFDYFRDYRPKIRQAAYFLGRTEEQIAAELPALAGGPSDADAQARLRFLRGLGIEDFLRRLADPEQRGRLARAIRGYVQILCEDTTARGVPAAIEILDSPAATTQEKIGVIRCLNLLAVDPLSYTYSREPSDAETPRVAATWETWWERTRRKFPPLDAEQRKAAAERFAAMVAETSMSKLVEQLDYLDESDARLLMETLLAPGTLHEKAVAAIALRKLFSGPLKMDLPLDAAAPLVEQVAENWKQAHYLPRLEQYRPGFCRKSWYIVADTQYAHMLWRLATFNFGRSALKTREPVSGKILAAVIVSAPLMLLSELMVYLVAVPLGILCAVTRGGWTDRLISLGLFMLYSIPPFVAGMLFLLLLCYGDYLKWFPMMGLHGEGAEYYGAARYWLDYLWHSFLPVTCLSLFSLAGLAMYGRASMLDVIGQDYIRTARAKGLSESKVILKHGLRNALIPIITLFSTFLPAMLGGSVLIEVLFNIPGMGRLGWESIEQKDFPTLMALTYIEAIVVMLSILLSDLLYVWADPRISFESQGTSA